MTPRKESDAACRTRGLIEIKQAADSRRYEMLEATRPAQT
jgi:hypothetical protein